MPSRSSDTGELSEIYHRESKYTTDLESPTPYAPTDDSTTFAAESVNDMTIMELLRKYWVMLSVYIFAYSTVGLGLALIGPALNILGRQVGVSSTSELSTIFIARAAGFLVGSILGGQVVDRYGKKVGQGFTCFCLFGSALVTASYPWASSFFHLLIISFFAAMFMGAIDNLLQVLLLALFKEKSPPFMQALHVGFGLGAFIAPLFVAAFLEGEDENGIANGPYEWSFYTMAFYVILITIAAILITFQNKIPVDHSTSSAPATDDTDGAHLDDLAETHSEGGDLRTGSRRGICGRLRNLWDTGAKTKNGFHGTGMVLVSASALLLWLYVGSETGYGNLISSYATKMNYMGDSDAALLASVFWGFFLVGRIIGVAFSLKFPPELLIIVDLTTALASVTVLAATNDVTLLWVFSGALGAAVGSLYAAVVVWLDSVVEMSGQVLSIVVVWVCLGEALFPLMMSLVMEVHARGMLIFHVAVLFGCCVLFAFMRTYRKKHSR